MGKTGGGGHLSVIDWTVWQWLGVIQHELLLFAAVFFLIGAVDDFAVDLAWIWLKLRGRAQTPVLDRPALAGPLPGPVAVFVPAWDEADVIGKTIAHMSRVWPQRDLRLYIGVYCNDPATIAAAMRGAASDRRVRIVILDCAGPSTKADCLNRLYTAMEEDERRLDQRFTAVVFHDAEDMADPAGLGLLAHTIANGAQFAQLPVEPLPQSGRDWLGSHYCEEFAESHGKAMVVREAMHAALPAAGVGCAIGRDMLETLCRERAAPVPFEPESLTEDYELGLAVARLGGQCRFVRVRGDDGALIATRAYFPSRLVTVVRQKTRWVHGIALQGWDRTGWWGGAADGWMRLRDRRGPLSALVLLAGYTMFALTVLSWIAVEAGAAPATELSPLLAVLLLLNLVFFAWRALWRFAFTARSYGIGEGLAAVARIPVTNVIAIMAGWRALRDYTRTFRGRPATWDKTAHDLHPARARRAAAAAGPNAGDSRYVREPRGSGIAGLAAQRAG